VEVGSREETNSFCYLFPLIWIGHVKLDVLFLHLSFKME